MKLVADLSPLGLPWRPRSGLAAPGLVLDFAAGRYAPGGFGDLISFSRGSTATYIDAAGNRQAAAVDAPRFTHDPATGAPLGLLVEESRTNLLLNSAVLVTQGVAVTAQSYTLSFTGSGSVTLSGAAADGPLTGAGDGEANRVSLSFIPAAGTLTLTVSGTVTDAQLEAGATPTSYIPTAGAAVTRAADSVVLPAANLRWPAPQVVGAELTANGTFDADTDWTKGAGWTIGGGKASKTAGSTSNLISGAGVVEGGKSYLVRFDISDYAAGYLIFYAGLGGSGNSTGTIVSDGSYAYALIGGASDAKLYVQASSTFVGAIDNISVQEIAPLGVSLQLEGRMTYADEDAAGQVRFLTWAADGSNRVLWTLDTSGANSGKITVSQKAAGTEDISSGAAGGYSEGVLTPFNIAGRHGSTFIQGAAEGAVFAADVTPTALPDLSGTDLQLSDGFTGTIRRFRMWGLDLGESGIGKASA